MADHTLPIEDDQQEADREKGGAKILRLEFCRRNEEERLGQLQVRQNRSKSDDHRGDPARAASSTVVAGMRKRWPSFSAGQTEQIKIEKMLLPEDRLHVAADEVENNHTARKTEDAGVQEHRAEKLPGIRAIDAAIAEAQVVNDDGRDVESILERNSFYLYLFGLAGGEVGHLFHARDDRAVCRAPGGVAAVVVAFATYSARTWS